MVVVHKHLVNKIINECFLIFLVCGVAFQHFRDKVNDFLFRDFLAPFKLDLRLACRQVFYKYFNLLHFLFYVRP